MYCSCLRFVVVERTAVKRERTLVDKKLSGTSHNVSQSMSFHKLLKWDLPVRVRSTTADDVAYFGVESCPTRTSWPPLGDCWYRIGAGLCGLPYNVRCRVHIDEESPLKTLRFTDGTDRSRSHPTVAVPHNFLSSSQEELNVSLET